MATVVDFDSIKSLADENSHPHSYFVQAHTKFLTGINIFHITDGLSRCFNPTEQARMLTA